MAGSESENDYIAKAVIFATDATTSGRVAYQIKASIDWLHNFFDSHAFAGILRKHVWGMWK
jgi:predicted O-linked N-acetylglucosamine transferase (SPINDLY family)